MKFSVISLFPEMIKDAVQVGVVGQAIQQNKIKLEIFNPRSWTQGLHKTVDDRPYGGGDGMVMLAEPLAQCLDHVISQSKTESQFPEESPKAKPRFIFLSPQGKTLNHSLVMELAREEHLVLLCGRYAGVDQRLLNQYAMEEVSLGDYVLSGGELGALVLIDAIGRQIEGVLGHENSSSEDSFANEGLLEAPSFTRPREWKNSEVPEFLLTGNHAQISEDRWLIGLLVTFVKRFDLFKFYMDQLYLNKQSRSPLAKVGAGIEAGCEAKIEIKAEERSSFSNLKYRPLKVWKRAFERLIQLSNKDLTTLGFSRKNLEDFEQQLKFYKIISHD